MNWLFGIPVPCLMGLIFGVALLLLPIFQFIAYLLDWIRYGKDYADEIARRF